ncbi:unnamed protein product [Clavelina lepadiformis]|uniref:Uncharacterized protein n=1 Tax=Clavelina lepadiformis TaxID=159417 RepID=A0ABP0FA27_CLALP
MQGLRTSGSSTEVHNPEVQSMAVFAEILGTQNRNSGVQGSNWCALRLVAQACPAFMVGQ